VQLDFHATLRAIMCAKSLAVLAQALTSQVAASRSVVLARVWFVGPLKGVALAGSAGTPSGGGSYTRLDGEFREMAVADAKIQEIAARREPFIVRGIRGDEDWLTNSAWAARQGVRAFVALPLIADQPEQALGVLAFFDREMPDDNLLSHLRTIADLSALRTAELRARVTSVPEVVLTRAELRRIEKESIEAALARTGGRVFGDAGAAVLLGMRPTTLASRIKALGITRS
jgi:transcriptional regulator with GAF, ATPase, and Fis domain